MSGVALTALCQNGFSSAGLVAALEAGWAAIRAQHRDVPEAVIVVGSGSPSRASGSVKWGHFASSQWQRGSDRVAEVLVSGEGLRRSPVEVFTTLLHEATHGVAATRSIADTSRQGRWHNKRFAALAGELGLVASKSDKLGWSTCVLATGTAARYADTLTTLAAAMSAYRHPDETGSTGQRSSTTRMLECACPRRIRASVSTVDEGPILCGVCETRFSDDEAG